MRAEPREEAGGNSLELLPLHMAKRQGRRPDLSHPYTAGDEFPTTRGCAVHAAWVESKEEVGLAQQLKILGIL